MKKCLDIELSKSYNIKCSSGYGGIGRRVRLRGVCPRHPGSSPGGRTKKHIKRCAFSFAIGLELLATCSHIASAECHHSARIRHPLHAIGSLTRNNRCKASPRWPHQIPEDYSLGIYFFTLHFSLFIFHSSLKLRGIWK